MISYLDSFNQDSVSCHTQLGTTKSQTQSQNMAAACSALWAPTLKCWYHTSVVLKSDILLKATVTATGVCPHSVTTQLLKLCSGTFAFKAIASGDAGVKTIKSALSQLSMSRPAS